MNRMFRALLSVSAIVFAIVILMASALAQSTIPLCKNPICLRVENQKYSDTSPTMTLWVTSWNPSTGLFVQGLEKNDFWLQIDGNDWLNPISVSSEHARIDFHFLIDTSDKYQAEVASNLERLVNELNLNLGEDGNRGDVWLVGDADAIEPLTGDGGRLVNRLNWLNPNRANSVPLETTLSMLVSKIGYDYDHLPYPRQVLVVLTPSSAQLDWNKVIAQASSRFVPLLIVPISSEFSNSNKCAGMEKAGSVWCYSEQSKEVGKTILKSVGTVYMLHYDAPIFPDSNSHPSKLELRRADKFQSSLLGEASFSVRFPVVPNTHVRIADLPLLLLDLVVILLLFMGLYALVNVFSFWWSGRKHRRRLLYGLLLLSLIFVVSLGIALRESEPQRSVASRLINPIIIPAQERLPTAVPTMIALPTSIITPLHLIPTRPSVVLTNTPSPVPTSTTVAPSPTPMETESKGCDPQTQYISDPSYGFYLPIAPGQVTVTIRGTAHLQADFWKYEVDYYPPGGSAFVHILTSEQSVINDVRPLATWSIIDPTSKKPLPSGWYIISLRVIRKDGNGLPIGPCLSKVHLGTP